MIKNSILMTFHFPGKLLTLKFESYLPNKLMIIQTT